MCVTHWSNFDIALHSRAPHESLKDAFAEERALPQLRRPSGDDGKKHQAEEHQRRRLFGRAFAAADNHQNDHEFAPANQKEIQRRVSKSVANYNHFGLLKATTYRDRAFNFEVPKTQPSSVTLEYVSSHQSLGRRRLSIFQNIKCNLGNDSQMLLTVAFDTLKCTKGSRSLLKGNN